MLVHYECMVAVMHVKLRITLAATADTKSQTAESTGEFCAATIIGSGSIIRCADNNKHICINVSSVHLSIYIEY